MALATAAEEADVTTGNSNDIAFVGDPHGDYSPVRKLVSARAPAAAIFLGDMDLEVPFDQQAAPLLKAGIDVWYVHGNHDTDREHWHDNLFETELGRSRNLTGRVVEIAGVRVAGLGGVFREKVWHPKGGDGEPRFRTRQDFMAANMRSAWRGGLPRGQRSSIFWEDVEALADEKADVLVTHEAPSCHRYGFKEIDFLAQMLGVTTIVHGHHHESYVSRLPSGIEVIGLNKAEILKVSSEDLRRSGWRASAAE